MKAYGVCNNASITKQNWNYKTWIGRSIWSINTTSLHDSIKVVALWFISPHNVFYGYWWALSVQKFDTHTSNLLALNQIKTKTKKPLKEETKPKKTVELKSRDITLMSSCLL